MGYALRVAGFGGRSRIPPAAQYPEPRAVPAATGRNRQGDRLHRPRAARDVSAALLLPVFHHLLGPHHGRPHGKRHASGPFRPLPEARLFLLRPQQYRGNDVQAGFRPLRHQRTRPSRAGNPADLDPENRRRVRDSAHRQHPDDPDPAGGHAADGAFQLHPKPADAPHLHRQPAEDRQGQRPGAGFARRHPRGPVLRQ
ncbi:hypothetical protein SDC9_193854 [bioreactor metagenome]|uniref:Uncharacterized protein n=1 Tax=bioreactor metagenome TaxID=1076179 RepID=A0A645I7A7_9ZZZZ